MNKAAGGSARPQAPQPLGREQLRSQTPPDSLPKAPGEALHGLIGQERANRAIRLATEMRPEGFNVFVCGESGSGRHSGTLEILRERATRETPPDEWVYVNNFKAPDKPQAIRLPGGMAARFRDAMGEMVADLSAAIPTLFESDEYKARRGAIDQEAEDAQEADFEAVTKAAQAKSIVLMRTPVGFAFAPRKGDEIIKPDEFEKLPEAEKERIQDDIDTLQEQLKGVLSSLPRLEKKRRDQVRQLNQDMASGVVRVEIDDVRSEFKAFPEISAFLDALGEDVVANFEIFLEKAAEAQDAAVPVSPQKADEDPKLRRYGVNIVVGGNSDGETGGAPVVNEPNPTFQNLIGRVEHISQMGALVTDFMLIKPGALHKANGGYLVLNARDLLMQPGSWDALKRALRSGEIRMGSLAEQYSLVSTVSLEPDAIPLKVKVVLIGDRMLYYMLHALDPDFGELFKVQADFDEAFDRTPKATAAYANLIDSLAARESMKPLARAAVARLIDEAARQAEDAEKLSLRVGVIGDILREADHWAGSEDAGEIGVAHIERAITERQRRSGRIRERAIEAIARGIMLVDVDGEKTGQVNGLSVLQLGETSFGKPSRITARVRVGAGKVIDIEREVELGGALHSKGVLILSGFLAARYAPDKPMSLSASLVFEQSYGGVDGDSASSAELYALLSALAEAPIRQDLAVTGSVNQFGEVQAIGGVNEKIEGFFDVCMARGLTGRQGVLIPKSNIKHLMLRPDVVEACCNGEFAVYPVSSIDEGIALLTGVPAGELQADGRFPPDSINARVEARLEAFASSRRAFARPQPGNGTDGGAGNT
ncbi:MAG: AAA family ATPase [Rhodobiaceae bacterium]|nr:AAA family ATPase [Rhodobiaceae bacterium]